MNFEFSDEQGEIRDSISRVLRAQCDYKKVRNVLENNSLYDHALWKTMGEMGWLAVAVPEEYGGHGLGATTLCVVAEEIGRVLAPVPLSSSIYLAANALLLSESELLKKQILPELISGKKIATIAFSEKYGQSITDGGISSRVVNGNLSGSKFPVPDGQVADYIIVTAYDSRDRLGLFLVDKTHKNAVVTSLECIDPTRPLAHISFDSVPVVEICSDASVSIRNLINKAAVFVAFEQLGGAQAALQMSCDYARFRHAFGRPIGSFQAIKHKLVDMYTRIELARSNAYFAAWAAESNSEQLALAASAARIAATDAFEFSAKETIQTHGGIGATWEADMHLFYRRSKSLLALLDAPANWRNQLVTALGG